MTATPQWRLIRDLDARLSHGGRTLWETPDGIPVSMAGALPEVVLFVRARAAPWPSRPRPAGS
ncbi:hypothetical protein [Streptomyces griseus]|uniref:hypothetical protein n=1 Tax=Streptomyces griseus TaxID=1911 RepID=UPI00131DB535|nr:hypothetical protein [Streptomyces griseus]